LVTWWSQWSKFIYDKLLNYLKKNNSIHFNFFVILWIKNLSFKNSFDKFSNVKTFDFLTQKQMWYLYSICDLWISRGSATLLAEQKLRNMKLIIIPLLWTWWNHQYYNWLFYEKTYNDILIKQNDLVCFNDILLDYTSYKKLYPKITDVKKFKELVLKYLV
jgi:UDP-N-acetylglucosamine:LPS N-acetylglucosamine transferase